MNSDQWGCAVEHTLHVGGVITSSQIGGNACRGAFGKIIAVNIWPYKYAWALHLFVIGRYSEERAKTSKFQYKQ